MVIYFFQFYKKGRGGFAGHIHRTGTNKTRKVVAHSSGLQKLENSNLKILKFEARFTYAVKFWTDFFDMKSTKFSPYDILSKHGNLLFSIL